MEKNNGAKIISVIALCVAVVALSIGLAFYTTALDIKPRATVTASNDAFKVEFSSSIDTLATSPIVPTKNPTTIEATSATINNAGTNPTISDLHAEFTAPGQSAEYVFYVRNTGNIKAYLDNISYNNISAEIDSFKSCVASEGSDATVENVNAACTGISVSLQVGADADANKINATGTQAVNGYELGIGAGKQVKVTITYDANAPQADGDFEVTFGDIKLTFDTMDVTE